MTRTWMGLSARLAGTPPTPGRATTPLTTNFPAFASAVFSACSRIECGDAGLLGTGRGEHVCHLGHGVNVRILDEAFNVGVGMVWLKDLPTGPPICID